jgi:hypothetical protein
LQVRGIMGAVDALSQLSQGFDSFKDAATQAIQSVLQELIRLQMMKLAVNLFGSAMGAPSGAGIAVTAANLPGFAGGGAFNVLGRHGIDRNVLSLNGLPIANVSYGERLSVDNDNAPMPMGNMTFNFPGVTNAKEARQAGIQAAGAYKREVARAMGTFG